MATVSLFSSGTGFVESKVGKSIKTGVTVVISLGTGKLFCK